MRLNNAYQSQAFKWAVMMDGEMVELFRTQLLAIRAMLVYRRKHKANTFNVVSVKELFDAQ